MSFVFDTRPSESSFVEGIYRTQSGRGAGSFISTAASHWEMVLTRQYGRTMLTVRGPETHASRAPIPDDARFLGIIFKLGTFMPHLPVSELVNGDVTLPEAAGKSFWLHGASWQFPDFENVDVFVTRLVREGLIVRDPVVEAALQGQPSDVSLRSVQRRFLRATGLTHGALFQIERARRAAALLEGGASILDAVELAGYADQAHLTRSLKRYMGQTPAQMVRMSSLETAAGFPLPAVGEAAGW